MDEEIKQLNQKLDALTTQVQYLTTLAQIAERGRQDRAELMHDAMPIANDVMRLATAHFQDVQDYVNIQSLVRITKKLARHLPDIEKLLDQIDGVNDLFETIGTISKGIYNSAENALVNAERKGYFVAAKGGMQIIDNIVTSFSADEIKQLGENIVLILRTIKDMTQPEVMQFLRNTVAIVEEESEKPIDISYRSILGQMRDPQVRRGLAQALRVLSSLGKQE